MHRDSSIVWTKVDVGSLNLHGMNTAVIGGTGGIGRSIAHDLAKQGANVLVVGRTSKERGIPRISFMEADLSLMREARRVASELDAGKLDLVIMTTGIMAGPKREVTTEGLERDLAVSYLSRYVILNGIVGRLGTDRVTPAMRPRVFVMGFPGSGQSANVADLNSERSYGRMKAHMNTVAGNEALVLDVARRFAGVDVFGLNPGFVTTGIRGNLFGSALLRKIIESLTSFMAIKPELYSRRITPLLVSVDLAGRSGAMFDNKAQAILASSNVANPTSTAAIISASQRLLDRVIKDGDQPGAPKAAR